MNTRTSSRAKVVIVDYGTGNFLSVKKTVDRMMVDSLVTSHAKDFADADKIILPGVGHFGTAMSNLNRLDLVAPLNEAVLGKQIPVLGICLGMELMARHSEEGDVPGLGWLDAVSIRFRHSDTARYKVPHIGWNQVSVKKKSRLMNDVSALAEFYFLHSYYLKINDPSCLLGETEYETIFPSAIETENVFGVQFHPEKSHDSGRRILENFIRL